MTSALEELVSLLVVPLRMNVSLIPVLVLKVLILIVLVLILIKPWCATIFEAKEEVIELDDSLRWAEVSQSLWTLTEVGDFISELRHHGRWKIFSKKYFCHLLKSVDRIPWHTIKPSSGMMCQGVMEEIQTKGVIGDSIHFDALGDLQEFVKMLVSIVTRKTMKLARILNLLNHLILKSKFRCLNSNRGNWSTPTIKRWLA
nr:hypothetical protein [Tanacetum cinerariifolium]